MHLHSEHVNRCRGSTSLKWTDAVLQDQALLITSCIWTVFSVLVKPVGASSTSSALRGHYPAVWSHDPTALLHNPDNKQSAKYQTHTHTHTSCVTQSQADRPTDSRSPHPHTPETLQACSEEKAMRNAPAAPTRTDKNWGSKNRKLILTRQESEGLTSWFKNMNYSLKHQIWLNSEFNKLETTGSRRQKASSVTL